MQSYDRPASDLLVQQWSTSGAVDAKENELRSQKANCQGNIYVDNDARWTLVPHAHFMFHGLFAATVALEGEGSFQLT